jgi:hypothetical protein
MKRRDLLKELQRIAKDAGAEYEETEGGRHTKVTIGDNKTVVPRHPEIADNLAKQIIKQAKGEDTK